MSTKAIFIRYIQFTFIIFEAMAGAVPQSTSSQFRQFNEDSVLISPCPHVFEYKIDEHGLYGVVSVHSNVYKSFYTNRLKVILFIRLSGQIVDRRNIGKLYLLHDLVTTYKMIEMRHPIRYRIDFPDHPTLPSVLNITVNRQIMICTNERPWNIYETTVVRYQFGFVLRQQPNIVSALNPAVEDVDETTKQNEFDSSTPLQYGCGKIDNKYSLTYLTGGGGVDVDEIGKATWPWMVAIYLKTTAGGVLFKCTGTLLSNRIVVSAAHCFVQQRNRVIRPSNVLLSFGRHNLRDWTENGLSNVERIEVPEEYMEDNNSDIAILISQEFIEYSALIKPICLWPSMDIESSDTSDIEGLTGTIVGWGKQNEEDIVNVPHKTQLKIVANDLCLSSSSNTDPNRFERIICAESKTANGPCKGDSGNGLAIWQNDAWFLRGIISAVIGDPILNRCKRNKYIILTDINKFSAWIAKWMNKFQ